MADEQIKWDAPSHNEQIKWSEPKSASENTEPTFGEKAGAVAYGAATGLAGGLGELEQLGIKGSQYLPDWAKIPESEGTFFPTVEDIKKRLEKWGVSRPREEVSGYETGGEIAGGLATSAPGIVRKVLGETTRTAETAAKEAEKMGFKLSPSQVRADEPMAEKGATGWAKHNQDLANRLASKGTGVEVNEISPKFIESRYRDLGREFDNLYQGRLFNVDQNAVNAIHNILQMEQQLPGVASSTPVKQAAENIVNNFQRLANRPGANPNSFAIEGESLQRLRNALTQRARSTSGQNAHEIYNLVDEIDASIARNHPQIANELNTLRPKYRNTVILDDLNRANGIKGGNVSLQKLGGIITKRPEGLKSHTDIDELGRLGKELGMKARWETAGSATDEEKMIDAAIRKVAGLPAVPLGLKSRGARAIQRAQATPTGKKVTDVSQLIAPVSIGGITNAFEQNK